MNKAQMDCFAKRVTFHGAYGRKNVFRGEINVIPNCIVLAMTTRKMIKKGYEAYLALVMETKKKKGGNSIIEHFSSERIP
jgi:hypothetical protein